MTKRTPKREPGDLAQTAFAAVQKATGGALTPPAVPDTRNAAAVALGKLGASKGGNARAKALTSSQRRKIAKNAAISRWGK